MRLAPLQQPVQHGIGDRGVSYPFVPVSDRELARDDRRVQLGTVFDHLEQIGCLVGVERTDQEIVDDEDVNACPAGHEP